MEHIPIFIFHRGDDEYINYSLQQAKISNPHSDLFLCGNPINEKYCLGTDVKHVLIEDYNQGALAFEKVYYHTGPNSYIYNLFCFQRWYVLRDFMRAQHLRLSCQLDSDYMLYTNVTNEKYTSIQAPWICIITLEELEAFCELTFEFFRNPILLQYIWRYTTEELGHPAISDMVTLDYFNKWEYNPKKLGYFTDSFFDRNISYPDFYEPFDNKKMVYFRNDKFYCKDLKTNTYQQALAFHFQGDGKKYMKYFLSSNISTTKTLYFNYVKLEWLPHEPSEDL